MGIYGILVASPLSDLVAGTVITILTVRFFKNLKSSSEVEEEKTIAIADTHPGTIVTIARQHGTCGKKIGELVAKKLEVPFYCKELTAIAAKESGLAEEYLSNDYDQTDNVLQELYLSTHVSHQSIIAQEKILRKIADNGACVIVGRAANHVLWNYENVLKVYLYAPEDYRIDNIQKMYGDTPEEAKKHMHRSDEARAAYYRSISGYDWNNMGNYNICLDASIGTEATATLIADYVKNLK